MKTSLFKNINPELFLNYNIGLEREGLRINAQGELSTLDNPKQLGSSLTNPNFTTDFAEQQIEIISDPKNSIETLFKHFKTLHAYALQNMHKDEILWNYSMPCHLVEDEVKIAKFGNSNLGKFKTLYRKGLAKRYGKKMQTISGIHFNFSFADNTINKFYENSTKKISIKDFKSEMYLHICRNFLRLSPFLTYIFGESPLYLRDFTTNKLENTKFKNDYYYTENTVSFRMSDLGYTNSNYCKVQSNYKDIYSYIDTLKTGLTTECDNYKHIGKNNQINYNILQTEAEYYNSIRPKPIVTTDKRSIDSLKNNGIEYIEFRGIDIDPNECLGISKNKLYFLHLFIIYTLSIDSPLISKKERIELKENQKKVAINGMDTSLQIINNKEKISFRNWSLEILNKMKALANKLDSNFENKPYKQAVNKQIQIFKKLKKSKLRNVLAKNNMSLNEYIFEISKQHSTYLKHYKIPNMTKKYLDKLTEKSLIDKQNIEDSDKISFAEYIKLNNYK